MLRLSWISKKNQLNLPILVKREIDAFKAKYLLIMDGSRFVENKPTLTFGARGIAKVDMTLFGPNVPVHSGHMEILYNPIYEASRLISSLKDSDGKVFSKLVQRCSN